MSDPILDLIAKWRGQALIYRDRANGCDQREFDLLESGADDLEQCADELDSVVRGSGAASPQHENPLMHLDAGKDTVCQTDEDNPYFTDDIELVTCLTCLRHAAQSDHAAGVPASSPDPEWQPTNLRAIIKKWADELEDSLPPAPPIASPDKEHSK